MDVKYTPQGEKGKTCLDCKNFEKSNIEGMGKCFGKDVSAKGSCNFFKAKA